MLLYKSKMYYVKTEYEVEGGYIDIVLLKGVIGQPRYYAMFELKYIKKEEYEKSGEEIVEKKLSEGIEQLKRYVESEELKNMKNMRKYVLVYVGEKCKRIEEI